MSKISDFVPVQRGELDDAPEWVDRLMRPIYLQLDVITKALQRKLTRSDNMGDEVKEIDLHHGVPVVVGLNPNGGKVSRVVVLSTVPSYYTSIKLDRVDIGEALITVVFNDEPDFSATPPTDRVLTRLRFERE